MIRQVADLTNAQRRTNRRGQATRDAMLDAALRALATGDVAAASANRIAKDAGATWGAVKYQFGDIDGLWAAVLQRTAERRGQLPSQATPEAPLRERVAAIIDLLFDGLSAPDSRAIALSMSGLTALSGKIASTPSARIWRTSSSTSPADACACVDSEGITEPTTSIP